MYKLTKALENVPWAGEHYCTGSCWSKWPYKDE